MPTLDQLTPGETGRIAAVRGAPGIVQRLLEMGVTDGETVEVLRLAPFGDPLEIRIRGYELSLRRGEARVIEIERGG